MIETLSCPNRCDVIVFSSIRAYLLFIVGKYSRRCNNTTRVPFYKFITNYLKTPHFSVKKNHFFFNFFHKSHFLMFYLTRCLIHLSIWALCGGTFHTIIFCQYDF